MPCVILNRALSRLPAGLLTGRGIPGAGYRSAAIASAQRHRPQESRRGEFGLEQGDLGLRVGGDELRLDGLVVVRQPDHDSLRMPR